MSLKLSDFQTLKELGSGSFGTVRLVRKKDTEQLFAMKTISLTKLTAKEKDNALNQVRLLASIDIPNVIGYKASLFDKQSASLCIFMEYADGGDLQSKLKQLREDETRSHGFQQKYVWKVAYEILQGLKMLHNHKIIHRDIKSANIFFVNDRAKLGDMNVSKVAEQGMAETQTGTPYYTSPEIWLGKRYSNKCDIWSLGVLLYEMCCLRMPFTGRDFPSLYKRVIEGKYEELSEYYSQPLQNLVRMCLIVEDQMRPSAAQLLETAILRGMEASLTSFNAQEGVVQLLDPIKCPKVLRFLAVKLPKPRFDQQRKVTFTKTPKTPHKEHREESSFKIKSVRKIRSEKHIRLDDSSINESKIMVSGVKQEPIIKHGSRKLLASVADLPYKLDKVPSKKNIKLPPLEDSNSFLHPYAHDQKQERSIKKITSSRKIINTSNKSIKLDKQN